ncbi:MAG: hypothetical protein IKP28_02870 [Clostridia bacterium]|nr:hypothetical protein [Clostridia bacterium]
MVNAIKEIFIFILLCIAIALVFGVAFYDFIPLSKTIPEKVAYTVPEEVKTELNSETEVEEIKTQPITYMVSASDLREYERATTYQPGNPNPFQPYNVVTESNAIINGTTGTGTTNSTRTNTQTYYPSTDTK